MKKSLFICLIAFAGLSLTFSCSKTGLKPAKTDSLNVGLIAYYPFNNSAADVSGNNYNGTAHNVTTVTDHLGNQNGAYYFKGDSTSYISVPDYAALRLANTDFTINVWVELTTYNSSIGSHIVSKRLGSVDEGYTYSVDGYGYTGGVLGVQGFGAGGGSYNAVSDSGITLNKWYMLTLEYSSKSQSVAFFRNGLLNGITYYITAPDPNETATMYFGKDSPQQPTTYFLNGAMSEARIYSRILKPGELTALYTETSVTTSLTPSIN